MVGRADLSLFVKKTDTGCVVIVIYVDDLILIGSDENGMAEIKAKLKKEFDIKYLGDPKFFLRILEVVHGSVRPRVPVQLLRSRGSSLICLSC